MSFAQNSDLIWLTYITLNNYDVHLAGNMAFSFIRLAFFQLLQLFNALYTGIRHCLINAISKILVWKGMFYHNVHGAHVLYFGAWYAHL
jgi:hypothetical protein